jgi:hypothetical protein
MNPEVAEIQLGEDCSMPSHYGRPAFIAREDFRDWVTAARLNRIARVGGMLAYSFVCRCERIGRPIQHHVRDGAKRYRMLDIVARARADGLSIEPAATKQLGAAPQNSAVISHSACSAGARHVGAALAGNKIFSIVEILRAAQPLPALASGVYFLIDKTRVVYVGQSIKVIARVLEHVGSKRFNQFTFIPCAVDDLDRIESLYIHMLRPPLNASAGNGAMRAPIQLQRLLSPNIATAHEEGMAEHAA